MSNLFRVIPKLELAAVTALIPFLWLPDRVHAQKHTPLADQEIRARIEHEISETDINAMHVQVDVRNRVVTLTGTVPSLWAKNHLLDEATEVADVESVVSELTIVAAESDRSIADEVAKNIRQYVFYSIYDDVNIAVNGGVVTLTGRVTSPHHAQELTELASRVRGVREVKNEIKALPVSSFDDQLRYSIARQIYRDPMFWNYAIQVNPPIHIVVENGRVTLTGVVNSEVERRKAEIIARSTFGVFSVENLLRIDGKMPHSR